MQMTQPDDDSAETAARQRWMAVLARAGAAEIERLLADCPKLPRHTRLRGLVSKAFTPRAVEARADWVRGQVDDLLDAVTPRGRMEFMRDFAYPLPVKVIAGLLGVPLEDLDQFRRWSDEQSVVVDGGPSVVGHEALRKAMAAGADLSAVKATASRAGSGRSQSGWRGSP